MNKNTQLNFILITPLFFLLAHYLAMLPHEYMHSFTAWALGYKANPLALTYGGSSWSNMLLLLHMDENVNYASIFSTSHPAYASLIAFAGMGFANIPLFILSLFLLKNAHVKNKPFLYYFLLLFNLMNLGNFYDYVPIRTFSPTDDVANFVRGLNISPWYVYIIGGYAVAFLIWNFFARTMISAFADLKLEKSLKIFLLALSVGILFGFYGSPGFFSHEKISFFLSVTSWVAMPGIITLLWPGRE